MESSLLQSCSHRGPNARDRKPPHACGSRSFSTGQHKRTEISGFQINKQSMKPEELQQELLRLRWACRRGMRELDFWFLNYLEHAYANASREEQLTFQKLLGYQDQEIFEWMLETAQPTDAALRKMVVSIRDTSSAVARAQTDN
jgi:antitoxin CptB